MSDYILSLVYGPKVLHRVSQIPIMSPALGFAFGAIPRPRTATHFPVDPAMKEGCVSLPSSKFRGLIGHTPEGWPNQWEGVEPRQVGTIPPRASSLGGGVRAVNPGLEGVTRDHSLQPLHYVVGKTDFHSYSPETSSYGGDEPRYRSQDTMSRKDPYYSNVPEASVPVHDPLQ